MGHSRLGQCSGWPHGGLMRNVKPGLLVVDDDLPARMCLLSMLTSLHYAARAAPDGRTALAEIGKEVPDLIVSELNMLGMSGFELLSVVRRRFPSIRLIAMSSAFSGSGVPPGVAADAFYPKRAHPGLLLQIMEDITHPRRSMLAHRTHPLAPVWIPVHTIYLSRVPQDVLTGSRQRRWFASQNRLRPLPRSDSLCDWPLIEFRVAPRLATTEQHRGNSRDTAWIAECQLPPEECRDTVN
jgi:CheY-like chemotaxis protein